MTYFDCILVGSWMFVIGWYIGAIYLQNQNEKTDALGVAEKPEPRPDCQVIVAVDEGLSMLIRPDACIAWAGDDDIVDGLEEALGR
jgi:hypothetical protein